eukprot:3282670-Pyramimonas_sp.AAC.1
MISGGNVGPEITMLWGGPESGQQALESQEYEITVRPILCGPPAVRQHTSTCRDLGSLGGLLTATQGEAEVGAVVAA